MLLAFNWKKYFLGILGITTPSYVIVFVTGRCNMFCRMCFYLDNIEQAKKETELTIDEYILIAKNFGEIINLAVAGGEPFIRKDLPQICEAFYKYSGARFINIPTNGSLSEQTFTSVQSILKTCSKAQIVIELSVDAVGKTHDELRNHQGAFEKLLKTYTLLNTLKNEHPNLYIKVGSVLTTINQPEILSLCDFVHEQMKPDDFEVSLMHGKDKVRENHLMKIDLGIFNSANDKILLNRKSRKHTLFGIALNTIRDLVNKDLLNVFNGGKISSPCTAMRNLIVISENGDVFPCETISDSLGNIRQSKYNIQLLLKSEAAKRIDSKYKIRSQCSCDWGCASFNSKIYDWKLFPLITYRTINNWIKND